LASSARPASAVVGALCRNKHVVEEIMLMIEDGKTARQALAHLNEQMLSAKESIAQLATRLSKKDAGKKARISSVYEAHMRSFS